LTSDAPKQAIWYGLYNEINDMVGILGVIHFPSLNKRLKKCSRLVILPDYQGIGLGVKFLEEIAKIYKKQNFDFAITTTAKNLVNSLCKNDNWMLTRYGIKKPYHKNLKLFCGIPPRECVTYTFFCKKQHVKR